MASKDDVNNEKNLNREKRDGNRLNNEAQKSSKQTADNVKETANQYRVINDEFQSYADAINAANLEIQGSTSYLRKAQKEYDGLTSLANKLADNQKDFNQLSIKDLNNIKGKSKERKRELALLVDGLKEEERKLELSKEDDKISPAKLKAIEKRLDKTRALIAANDDGLKLESSITKQAQKQLDLEAKIAAKSGLTGSLIKSAAGVMKKLGVEAKIVDDAFGSANLAMRKMVIDAKNAKKEVSGAAVAFKGLSVAFSGLTKALSDPLAIFGFIVKAAGSLDKQITGFQKSLGIARDAARGLRSEMRDIAAISSSNFVTTSRLVETFGELTKEIGMSARVFNNDMLEGATLLMGKLHLSAAESVNILAAAQASGMSFDEIQTTIDSTVSTMNQQNKTMFSSSQIAQDVANVSKATLLTNQNNIKALSRAASEARRIGMNLSQSEKIAESLLNFESSIGSELEAQLMLGKSLNLGKAREAALAGDMETLNKEVGKQQAIFDAFNSKNVIAQEAAAKALGLSRQELAGVVQKQQLANMGAEEFEQRFGETALKQAMAQTNQDKFNDLIQKATELLGEVGYLFLPIISGITSIIKGLGPFGPALIAALVVAKSLSGVFGGMVTSVTSIGKGLLSIGGIGDKVFGKLYQGGQFLPGGKEQAKAGGQRAGGLMQKLFKGTGDKTKDIVDKTKGADGKKGASVGSFLKGLGQGLASMGKNFANIAKGSAALAIAGLALGGSFAVALRLLPDVDPATMLAFAGGLSALGFSLAAVGKVASGAIKGALALGIMSIGLIPAAYAFSLLAGVDAGAILAFSAALPILGLSVLGLGLIMSNPLTAIAFGAGLIGLVALGAAIIPLTSAFAKLKDVDIASSLGSITALGAAAGSMIAAGAGLGSLGAGLGVLAFSAMIAGPGIDMLKDFASIGSELQDAGTGVRSLADGIGELGRVTDALDAEKLKELRNLVITTAVAAPMLALVGGISNVVAGISGGRGGDNAALESKLDELIAITAEGKTIVMDGSVVGNTITRVSPKSS